MKAFRIAAGIAVSAALGAGGIAVAAAPASADRPSDRVEWGCVQGVGYYKNHVDSVANWQVDALPSIPVRRALFYMPYTVGLSLQEILDARARGDAELISAKQMIAAAMNLHHNWSATYTDDFWTAYWAFFNYYESGGVRSLTRQQMLEYAAALEAFNSGQSTLPAC